MEIILQAFVLIVQLALAGFVLWGGLLSVSAWLHELRGAREARPPRAQVAPAAPASGQTRFERVASLVLLALLCTTLLGLA
jgi:hypothetical protein